MISYFYSFVGLTRYLAKVFNGHEPVDPFDCPGRADLTGSVDFAYLAEALAGTGASHSNLTPFDLLKHCSIGAWPALAIHFPVTYGHRYAGRCAAGNGGFPGAERGVVVGKAAARLVDGIRMGREYKVV
jgi:hypothetical protein